MSELQDKIKQLRRDYASGRLDEQSVAANPIAQFDAWMQEALEA